MCFLAICMSSLESICFNRLSIFWLGFFFLYWTVWTVCVFQRVIPCQPLCLQIFFPILQVVFSVLFMVFFAVQNLLSLIRSHWFIFSEKAMAPHSSTPDGKIPWTEEPGRLQSMGSLRVGHDWATSLSLFTFMHWRRKWQPTPVFCLENPRDGEAWWAAVYGVTQSRTRLKWLSSSSLSFIFITLRGWSKKILLQFMSECSLCFHLRVIFCLVLHICL